MDAVAQVANYLLFSFHPILSPPVEADDLPATLKLKVGKHSRALPLKKSVFPSPPKEKKGLGLGYSWTADTSIKLNGLTTGYVS